MAVLNRIGIESLAVGQSVNLQLLNSSGAEFRKLQPSASGAMYDKVVLPSGKVDPDDLTLKHALVREVLEETGLDVTGIFAELKPMIYTTEKTIVDGADQEVTISKSAIQLNYVVQVAPGKVQLHTDEHSESSWASEGELDSLNITTSMRAVIYEAL
ncbi:hypothetical protein HD806DRAFT_551082 [Xylariaceae sp. AK1471]|nr:hypothetical protein HD806DRAFT_551082 [Xylariaceae sp. AK1471]